MPQTNPNPSVTPTDPIDNLVEYLKTPGPDIKSRPSTGGVSSPLGQYLFKSIIKEEFDPYFKNKLYNYTPGITEKQRAVNQSGVEQAGRALIRGTVGGFGRMFEYTANMLDFEDYWNQDQEVGNPVAEFINEELDGLRKSLPIYRENPDTPLDFGDPGYWYENGAQIAESAIGFAGAGFGLGKALQGVKWLSTLGKSAQYASKLETAIATVGHAAISNQAESIQIGAQVWNTSHDYAIQQGKSEEEAKRIASDAAAYAINLNRINIFLNLYSSKWFMKTGAGRNLLGPTSIKNTLKHGGIEGIQEYGEETINFLGENEANAYAKSVVDNSDYSIDFNKMMDSVLSEQGFEQGMLGFLGGMSQAVAVKGIGDRIPMNQVTQPDGTTKWESNLTQRNNLYNQQQEQLKPIQAAFKANGLKNLLNTVQDAEETINRGLIVESMNGLLSMPDTKTQAEKIAYLKEQADKITHTDKQVAATNKSIIMSLINESKESLQKKTELHENQLLATASFNNLKIGSIEGLENIYKEALNNPETVEKAEKALSLISQYENIYNKYANKFDQRIVKQLYNIDVNNTQIDNELNYKDELINKINQEKQNSVNQFGGYALDENEQSGYFEEAKKELEKTYDEQISKINKEKTDLIKQKLENLKWSSKLQKDPKLQQQIILNEVKKQQKATNPVTPPEEQTGETVDQIKSKLSETIKKNPKTKFQLKDQVGTLNIKDGIFQLVVNDKKTISIKDENLKDLIEVKEKPDNNDDLTNNQKSNQPEVDARQRQVEPRKTDGSSTANQAFETKSGKLGSETQFDESRQPIVSKYKNGKKEHRWALFLDKLADRGETLSDYTAKLEYPNENSNLLDKGQKATEKLWYEIINDPNIKWTPEGLIDTDKNLTENTSVIANSKYYETYENPTVNGIKADLYAIKTPLEHIKFINERLNLLHLLGESTVNKQNNPSIDALFKGIAVTLWKDGKQIFLDENGEITDNTEIPATAMYMTPTSIYRPVTKDGKEDIDSDIIIPNDLETLDEKKAYLKTKAAEVFNTRKKLLEGSQTAEIKELSQGIPIITEFKPLTEAQKNGQLTVATGEYTSVTVGKQTYRYKTTPGRIYVINKEKALYVAPQTHGVDQQRVTNLIDLIYYMGRQVLSKGAGTMPTGITINRVNDKNEVIEPVYLLNFAKDGKTGGLISDLLFWGPNGKYSHKIYIDFSDKVLVMSTPNKETGEFVEQRIPLTDLNTPSSENYKKVQEFISNKYFNINKTRLTDKNKTFIPDFTITKDSKGNLDNWTIKGEPVNYHNWLMDNAVGTNRPEAQGKQFSAVSHYLTLTNFKEIPKPKTEKIKKETVKTETSPDIEAKKADIERRREEELNQQTDAGYSTIALDYLFTGGRDVIQSTDYLLQALVGGFTHSAKEINDIRNKYADKLGNLKDDINSNIYNQMMSEIRDVINKNYNNSKATEIFDKILKNATGFTNREGNQTSIELDKLNEQNESKINAKYDAELAALEEKKEIKSEKEKKTKKSETKTETKSESLTFNYPNIEVTATPLNKEKTSWELKKGDTVLTTLEGKKLTGVKAFVSSLNKQLGEGTGDKTNIEVIQEAVKICKLK